MKRPRADLDVLQRRLGRDLALVFGGPSGWWEEADLAVARRLGARDLAVAEGIAGISAQRPRGMGHDAADQLLVNRLKTRRGELAALGHPEYGSRHHELLGQPNTERIRARIKLHVLECLGHEPRIAEVLGCEVTADRPARDVVRIAISVRLLDEDTPRNLVVPFSLGT